MRRRPRPFHATPPSGFLIIGGGAAGYNAAKAIRERNHTGSVVILAAEDELPYNRPMLTKSILKDFHCEDIAISPKDWYELHNITLLTGVSAASVDPEAKLVKTSTGAALAYDKLIYAAGARCFLPPIQGIGFENVVAIRSAKDAAKIISLLPKVKRAVVIGGGVLGIEAAWELRTAGAEVTVVEALPRVMSRQLDEGAARTLSMRMEQKGVGLRTGIGECHIEGETSAERVVLKSRRGAAGRPVVVSTGVVPNTELMAAAGARGEPRGVGGPPYEDQPTGHFRRGRLLGVRGRQFRALGAGGGRGLRGGARTRRAKTPCTRE